MSSSTTTDNLALRWPALDRRASEAENAAREGFEATVRDGGDAVAAWVAFRTACRARAELANRARAAATDELQVARIPSTSYGPVDFGQAVADAADRTAAERVEEALAELLAE